MSSITDRLQAIRAQLPEGVTLVAVSKFHPVEALSEAYAAGQRIFGESRENELRLKSEALPKDLEWHFIGHLQTNKVKYIAPFVSLIQSIDSERLLDKVQRQAARCGRTIDVLLELHVAQEASKSGFLPAEALDLLRNTDVARRWPDVRLRGVMGMASFVDDEAQIRHEFQTLRRAFDDLRDALQRQDASLADAFSIRSYGMSDDHAIAIQEGATMVRIGTDIFGARTY